VSVGTADCRPGGPIGDTLRHQFRCGDSSLRHRLSSRPGNVSFRNGDRV